MVNYDRNGAYANWTADFGMWLGRLVADSIKAQGNDFPEIDMSMMNVGGIRQPMKKGPVTEGEILSTFPFSNHMTIIEIKGKDIIDALRIAAQKGGEAISGNVRVVTDGNGKLMHVVINDKEMDPDKIYTVVTIDYVAQGNDDLVTMANNREIWRDNKEMSAEVLRYIHHLTSLGVPISSDPNKRFVEDVEIEIDQSEAMM